MISDKLILGLDAEKQYIYLNDESYYQVWINAVEKFGGEYFIYLQEDFILYNDINEQKIEEYVDFLKANPQYSFVRLLRSGNLYNKKLSDTLYEIESTNMNVFAMQATVWRTADYIRLMNLAKSPRWLESDVDYRGIMIALNMQGAYHYNGEERGGLMHNNSKVYPYIATALVRGLWNVSEYDTQLKPILAEYNIDLNKRGTL